MLELSRILSMFDSATGKIPGVSVTTIRRLSDLKGTFVDENAFNTALAAGNPILYEVTNVEFATGSGALFFASGVLYPGKIGAEYYLTKGHYHAWREASEIYIGLSGEGVILLETEDGSECTMAPLGPNRVVYVPGYVAHRTMNTSSTPLTYLGIYPAESGHDYGTIAKNNMRNIVAEINGKPAMMERGEFVKSFIK